MSLNRDYYMMLQILERPAEQQVVTSPYYGFPTLGNADFNYKYDPDAHSVNYYQLQAAIKPQPTYTNTDEYNNLCFMSNSGAVEFCRISKYTPALERVVQEIERRGATIKEFCKLLFRIENSDKFTEAEKTVICARGITDETQITKYNLPTGKPMVVDELYFVKNQGSHHYIVMFMADTNIGSDVLSYAQTDVVQVIEVIDGNLDIEKSIIEKIVVNKWWY